MMQLTINPEMESCIEACQRCHQACWQTAMTQCLQLGGNHVEADHFRLMLNCAELCQTAANFMLSESPQSGNLCAVCADVCETCADSCEQIGQMDDCVRACRQCAQECLSMGGALSAAGRAAQGLSTGAPTQPM